MPAAQQYYRSQPDGQPGFLQGEKSRAFGSGVGYFKDWYIETLLVGVRSRFCLQCPPDALPYHGDERGLFRYVGDSDDDYRARINDAWYLWTFGGTSWGVVNQLNSAGFPSVAIYENWQWLGFPPSISPITHLPYAIGDEWWRFHVQIMDTINPFGGLSFRWGDSSRTWGDGKLWGFTHVPPNWSQVIPIIKKWKPAHTILASLDILLDGWAYGEGGIVWGGGQLWGGTSIRIVG